MDRRHFVGFVAGALLAAPCAVRGQPAGRTYRLGLLHPGSPPAPSDPVLADTFTLPLRDLGYVEGRNLVVERRYAEGRFARLSLFARELAEARVDAILAIGPAAIQLAAKYRLPAIYEWPRHVRDGGLMSYGANDVATYAHVASYIDRIFKGAKAGDLPVWQPSKLELVINLRTAKALGLALPPALLLRADEVIQ